MKLLIALTCLVFSVANARADALRIGVPTNTAGWSFHDAATNTDKGIVYDLTAAMDLGDVQYLPMPFGTLIAALNDNRIDLIAGNLTVTPERAQQVDFSNSFFTGADGLVVAASDPTTYRTWDDLKGASVGTFTGSIYVEPLTKSGLFSEVKTYASPDDIVRDVSNGSIKAAIGPGVSLGYIVAQGTFANVRLVKSYQPKFSSKIALAVRKGDAGLLTKVNAALARLTDNGAMKAIFAKYGQ